MRQIRIGITGSSGSGKSTVARQLAEHYWRKGIGCQVISLDDFYRDKLPKEITNWDHPDAFDHECFSQFLTELCESEGKTVAYPKYNFGASRRETDVKNYANVAATVFIFEGIFAHHPAITHFYTKTIFVETNLDLCLKRRIERDSAVRNSTKEQVLAAWEAYVLPGYRDHILPHKPHANIVILNDEPCSDLSFDLTEVISQINVNESAALSQFIYRIASRQSAVVEMEHAQAPIQALTPSNEITIKKTVEEICKTALCQIFGDSYAYRVVFIPVILAKIYRDPNHLASTASIVTLLNDSLITSSSVLFALNILGAQLFNQYRKSKRDDAKKAMAILFQNGIAITIGLSLLNTPILFFSGNILKQFGQSPEDSALSEQFLRKYIFLIPPTIFELYAIQVLMTLQKTKYMLGGSAILAASLLASYGMSVGDFGLPNLGETGLIIGYALGAYATSIFYGMSFFRDSEIKPFFSLKRLDDWKVYWGEFLEQLKTVFPITLTILSELTMSFSIGNLAGILGVSNKDAFARMLPPLWINTIVSANFGLSALSRVAEMKYSQDKQQHVYPTAMMGILLTVLASSLIPLWMMFMLFDSDNASINNILRGSLPFFALNSVLDSACYGIVFIQRILGDNYPSSLIRVLGCCASMLLAYIFSERFDLGMNGIGLGCLLGTGVSAAALAYRSHHTMSEDRKKYRETTQADSQPSQSWCEFFSGKLGLRQRTVHSNSNAALTVTV